MVASAKGPVSVVLDARLRKALEREAKKRGLGLSPALRVLLVERLRDLADAEDLGRAEQWQRAAAWASWERAQASANPEVEWAEAEGAFHAQSRRRRRGT